MMKCMASKKVDQMIKLPKFIKVPSIIIISGTLVVASVLINVAHETFVVKK